MVSAVQLDTPIIDCDSHLSEPPDLWTARLANKWQEVAPHVVADDRGVDWWWIGDMRMLPAGATTMAGFTEFPPEHPPTLAEADPGGFSPGDRVTRLDEYGIDKQILYPNLLGFFASCFVNMNQPDAMKAVVSAYNDFVMDFAVDGDRRFIPVAALPYWDLDACLAELERCYKAGHKAVVFPPEPAKTNLPALSDPHWNPLFDAVQALDLSVSLHIGFGAFTPQQVGIAIGSEGSVSYAKSSTLIFMSNAQTVVELCLSDVCVRFPRLKFVSVESGFGYLPYLCQAMDWQWINAGNLKFNVAHPMPSEIFHRQVYATFWFEQDLPRLENFADNVMFSSDYPHPTSLSPGPNSSSKYPAEMAQQALANQSPDVVRKVLHDNAAGIYHLES
jgi:predicted TIM-barrel fold metal-dependent hydrolase